jgi:hypothetical protein
MTDQERRRNEAWIGILATSIGLFALTLVSSALFHSASPTHVVAAFAGLLATILAVVLVFGGVACLVSAGTRHLYPGCEDPLRTGLRFAIGVFLAAALLLALSVTVRWPLAVQY